MVTPIKIKWQYVLLRVLVFCFLSAVILATASYLTANLSQTWRDNVLLISVIFLTFGLTLLFARFEKISLIDLGVIPTRFTVRYFITGLVTGIVISSLHSAIVVLSGHLQIIRTSGLPASFILNNLLLYFLIACREELAFRGYPLMRLNAVMSSWKAIAIIAIIFSLEHVVSGMSWMHGFLGAGMGAILFGLAAIKTKGIAMPGYYAL